MKRRWTASAFLFAVLLTCANAQLRQAGPKLVGWGETGGGEFGLSSSISADGNTAIVGGPADNGQVGAAWVFTRRGSVWSQQGLKLVGTGAIGQSAQGYSVSISADGNTAIVGGNLDNTRVGAAWIFARSGEVWTQQGGKLVGTGAVGTPFQGQSVSMAPDGNTAIVGGWGDNGNTGAAWVFVRSVPQWTQQGSKLVGTGAVGTAEEGWSVSLSSNGNTAVVGGWNDNSSTGAAWIFTRSGSVWTQQGSKLVGTGAVGAAIQGISVSISADGNTAIVGGNQDNSNIGAAWVFARSGTVWTQQGPKLVGTGGVGMINQGYSVALSADGSTAIVGGPADNSSVGAAWIFVRSGSTWTQQGSKIAGTGGVGATDQGFSVSVSSDANTAIVSGYGDNTDMGAAWIYMNAPPTLRPVRDLPSDQGGTVVVNWDKSLLDGQVSTVVTEYWIWRGIRSPSASPRSVVLNWKEYCSAVASHTLTPQTFLHSREGDSPLAGDIYWQYILSLPSLGLDHYSYACPTLADSTSQGIPWRHFFITARTNDPNAYWNSQPDSGYSVDNLAPLTPGGALLTPLNNALRLQWNVDRTDPDVGHYVVYRSTTTGFPLADSTRFRLTTDSTVVDSSTIAGRTYYYRITTADIHGNESLPTQELGDSPLPIQLTSLSAQPSPLGSGVLLEWTTVSEVNNFGFEVQRSLENENDYTTLPNSFVAGHGTSNEPHHYTFIDSTASPGRWYYRLRQIDVDGTVHFSNGVSVNTLTGVSQPEIPDRFALSQNYPDPFNPSTTITYQLPTASHITLKIYNTMGQEVVTLVDGVQDAGYKSIRWDATRIASGVYFCTITAASGQTLFTDVRKMLVLK